MGSGSRPCIWEGCGKKGAYIFNNLCGYHWQKRIDANIKKVALEHKREWESKK